jgi:hypothetical protein
LRSFGLCIGEFQAVLAAVRGQFPIVAAVRGIAGNPRMVYDLWKGSRRSRNWFICIPCRTPR